MDYDPSSTPAPEAYAAASIGGGVMTFTALSSGQWANGQLLVDIDVQVLDLTADATAFNMTITKLAVGTRSIFQCLH